MTPDAPDGGASTTPTSDAATGPSAAQACADLVEGGGNSGKCTIPTGSCG